MVVIGLEFGGGGGVAMVGKDASRSGGAVGAGGRSGGTFSLEQETGTWGPSPSMAGSGRMKQMTGTRK